jgi:hypothetical protein
MVGSGHAIQGIPMRLLAPVVTILALPIPSFSSADRVASVNRRKLAHDATLARARRELDCCIAAMFPFGRARRRLFRNETITASSRRSRSMRASHRTAQVDKLGRTA